jgi:uncharacterized protein
MRFIFSFIQIVFFILLIDFYTFRAFKIIFNKYFSGYKVLLFAILYWSISIFFTTIFILIKVNHAKINDYHTINFFFYVIGFFILVYIPKVIIFIFQLIQDFINLFVKLFFNNKYKLLIISVIGMIISLVPFLLIIYGMVIGRYDYKVNIQHVEYNNLPRKFDNFKIVQISDFHLGTLNGKNEELLKIVHLVNSLQPDVIFFTGDLINNFADEVNGTDRILIGLKAKYGKFSILGNHDYGDYSNWKTQEDKRANLLRLISWHRVLGFKLLMNQADSIVIGDEKIAILGVENWGLAPFHKYGNLSKTLLDAKNISFKILLSHDPSHWSEEVVNKTDIELTLSGHTHGFQFGFNFGNRKWSPIKYKYPKWSGMYKNVNQYLYVNIGLGVIGYPGRIGMSPEITIIILNRK